MDPVLTVNQSDLYLSGSAHYNALRANTAEFRKITQPWGELTATYNNAPATTTTLMKVVPNTTSATQNSVVDLKDFWNNWKTANTVNYGMAFQLQLYNFVRARQQYYSSNTADTLLRPLIQFNVGIHYTESLETLSYYKLKDNFDGGYAKAVSGKLKIFFSEEYKIDNGKYIPLRIYDASHAFIGAVDLNGNVTGAASTPLLGYHFNDNRHLLDLSGLSLTNNAIYILEVKTSTGEKRYLKFLYKN